MKRQETQGHKSLFDAILDLEVASLSMGEAKKTVPFLRGFIEGYCEDEDSYVHTILCSALRQYVSRLDWIEYFNHALRLMWDIKDVSLLLEFAKMTKRRILAVGPVTEEDQVKFMKDFFVYMAGTLTISSNPMPKTESALYNALEVLYLLDENFGLKFAEGFKKRLPHFETVFLRRLRNLKKNF